MRLNHSSFFVLATKKEICNIEAFFIVADAETKKLECLSFPRCLGQFDIFE